MFLRICEIISKCILSPFLLFIMLIIWFWYMIKVGFFSFLEMFSTFLAWFKESELPKLKFFKRQKVSDNFPF